MDREASRTMVHRVTKVSDKIDLVTKQQQQQQQQTESKGLA